MSALQNNRKNWPHATHLAFFIFLLTYLIVLMIGIGWGLPSEDRHRLLTFERIISPEEVELMSSSRQTCAAHHTLSSAMYGGINRGSGENELLPDFPKECTDSAELSFRRFLFFGTAQDESRVFHSLSRMEPSNLDFHPRRFENGTAYLYPIGGLLFLAEKFGYVNLTGSVAHALDDPQNIRRIYLIGRLVSVSTFLGTLVLLFLIGNRFCDARIGFLAAVAYGSFGTVFALALQTRIHVVAAFWVTLAVYWLLAYTRTLRFREVILASIALGIGVGTAIHAALAVSAVILIVFFSPIELNKRLGVVCISGLIVIATFTITNPYSLIDGAGFWFWWSTYLTPPDSGGHGYSPHSWSIIFSGFKEGLTENISAARVPFFGVLAAGTFYALVSKDWEWQKLAVCVIFAVIVAATIGKASGRFLMFLWPIACLQMGILINRMLKELEGNHLAKFALLFVLFIPSYFLIAEKVEGLYVHEARKSWLSESIGCLEQLAIERGQTVGLFDYPRPNSFPPFPFLGTTLIFSADLEQELPEFVVVRDLEKDVIPWEANPIRKLYTRECGMVGAFSPVKGYNEQTISVYRKTPNPSR